jgi:hypothetical protein
MRLTSVLFLLLLPSLSSAQQSAAPATDDYSGMYTFLRDGEFVQITVEDKGSLSGFISRYGDTESDRDTFLDQFIDSGKLDANQLSFRTKEVHGVRFAFEGTVGRGAAKSMDQEGYYVIRGTLTRFKTDVDKKTTQASQKIEFKSFPRD